MANQYSGIYFANISVERDYWEKDKRKTELVSQINRIEKTLNNFAESCGSMPPNKDLGDLSMSDEEWRQAWLEGVRQDYADLVAELQKLKKERDAITIPARTLTYREWKKVPKEIRSTM